MQTGIRIALTSIPVEDEARALEFYTDNLGFVKERDIPLGEYRWLTVTSPAGVEGVELLLEPNAHPAAKAYQQALHEDGIPVTTFFVDDIQKEYERLLSRGVECTAPPARVGDVRSVVLDDTCGNWILLTQQVSNS